MTRILGPTETLSAGSPQEPNPYFDATGSFAEATAPGAFVMPGQRMDSGWFAIPMTTEMTSQPPETPGEKEPAWPAKEPDLTTEFLGHVIDGIRRIGMSDEVVVDTADTADTKDAEDTIVTRPVDTPIFDDVVSGKGLAEEITGGAQATDETPVAKTTPVAAKPLWPTAPEVAAPADPDAKPAAAIPEFEPETTPLPPILKPWEELSPGRPPLPRRVRTRPDTMQQQLDAKHRGRLTLGIVTATQEARVPGAALQQLYLRAERPSRILAAVDQLEPGSPDHDLEETVQINMARLAQPALHGVSVETIRAIAPVPTALEAFKYTQPALPNPNPFRKLLSAARALWRDLHPRKYAQAYDFSRLLAR